MIIKQIQAENILRYTKVALTNLPTVGVIGISGPNESGKTSTVEIICLALFGRTSTVEGSELTKVVKWGQFSGSIALEFVARDKNSYTVTRQFDRDGTQTSQLMQSGSTTPLARGGEAVNEAIVQLGGFTYQRFIDSFYLAQRNMVAPEVLKETVKVLSGVQTLDNIGAECESDIRTAQDAIIPLEPKISTAQKQLAELNIQEDALSQIQAQKQAELDGVTQAEAEIQQRKSASTSLQTTATHVAEKVEQFGATGPQSSLVGWQDKAQQLDAAQTSLADACKNAQDDAATHAGLSNWAAGLKNQVAAFAPVEEKVAARRTSQAWLIGEGERPSGETSERKPLPEQQSVLSNQLTAAISRRSLMIGLCLASLVAVVVAWVMAQVPIAIGLGVLAFIFFVLVTFRAADVLGCQQELEQVGHEIETVRSEVQTLDSAQELSLPEHIATLQGIDDENLSAAAASFAAGNGADLLDADKLSSKMTVLRTALGDSEKSVQGVQERLEAKMSQGATQIDTHNEQAQQLDKKITNEQARREAAGQLKERISGFEKERGDQLQQISVRRAAQQLLESTHPRLYGRFSLELQKVVGNIIPLLTEGRYENLRVGEDLEIQALSKEKGDFVSLGEVSGGTYFQLMLAIRLALSQAIITSSVGGDEFIILDEPFAFFDANRTQKTLEALPHMSNEIEQMWILAQSFADESQLDLHFRCSRDNEELIASGS
jgi:DNA repair exonuclease SbcCD ATPase subunit